MKFLDATKLDRKFGVPPISYIAISPKATYAAFRKESRMKLVDATNLDRKFGVPTQVPPVS
jgi:predicted deacylase